MKSFIELARERVLVFDGAMGTSIQRFNLTVDDFHGHEGCNEYLVISRPDIIEKIHASFLEVGCDIIETDTFGANRVVLQEYGLGDLTIELNRRAAELARKVAADYSTPAKPRFVSGSIGPGTKLPSLGHITFDELEQMYAEQALGLLEGGVDLFQIETGQDLLQLKAAYAGVRLAFRQAGKEVPVIVQVTMERTGRMLLGTDMRAVVTTFEPFDLFALGLNCATGPKAMTEHVHVLSEMSPFPISVLPNAGLPQLVNGKYVYDLTPHELAMELKRFVEDFGVSLVGGCCGTTPEHLKAVVDTIGERAPLQRKVQFPPSASSTYISQPFRTSPPPLIIGERTNANGSKKFRELLLSDNYDGMVEMALEQQAEQAHVLDLCVAYAGRDEVKDMNEMVFRLNTMLEIPIMLDTTEVNVLENALKRLGGRAIINSINLEDGGKRAREVLTLAKKFGAAVVALTIDEEGMARTVEKKLEVAKKLYQLAVDQFGLRPSDLFFDPLTFTLASGDQEYYDAGVETLEAIHRIKESFPDSHTLLGVSNISFGLKASLRQYLNSVFLYHAVQRGLDAAILHAGKIIPVSSIPENIVKLCEDVIFNRRTADYDPLHELLQLDVQASDEGRESEWAQLPLEEKLKQHIIQGRKTDLQENLMQALHSYSPLEIINQFLLEGMKVVGDLFGEGKMQLPFVLKSAEVMKQAVEILKPYMEKHQEKKKGRIVLATVKGDVHDIGKNLVDIILSNNGYEVINLGIKQTIEQIMEAVAKYQPDCIGMSGLLVKSTLIMKENLEILNDFNIRLPVICGGAALNRRFVQEVLVPTYKGKVYYGRDAMTGLKIMDQIMAADREEQDAGQVPGEEKLPTGAKRVTPSVESEESLEPAFDHDVPAPPFWGSRIVTGIPAEAVLPYLNRRILFIGRWQWKNPVQPLSDEFRTPESALQQIISESVRLSLFDLKVVYGYFPANRLDDETLKVAFPDEQGESLIFRFPVQSQPPHLGLAKYFYDEQSGVRDVVAFHLVTIGRKMSGYIRTLYGQKEYVRYFLWHGFSVELAEALAEYWHRQIRIELGIHQEDAPQIRDILKGKYRGRRYSFGYPACPNLEDQQKIFRLLRPERIGVSLTEEFQLVPEQSTSAIIVHHPSARYFAVGDSD